MYYFKIPGRLPASLGPRTTEVYRAIVGRLLPLGEGHLRATVVRDSRGTPMVNPEYANLNLTGDRPMIQVGTVMMGASVVYGSQMHLTRRAQQVVPESSDPAEILWALAKEVAQPVLTIQSRLMDDRTLMYHNPPEGGWHHRRPRVKAEVERVMTEYGYRAEEIHAAIEEAKLILNWHQASTVSHTTAGALGHPLDMLTARLERRDRVVTSVTHRLSLHPLKENRA